MNCTECQKTLEPDEIAIYRRMIFRDAEECLCADCLAKKFGVSRAEIDKKIKHFKEIGCTLFK
ncbi:MAG: hypothetical protein KBS59_01195 [Clostridiales bacterium]|nr:hypothetical protein [Clostridiales bacterium]